MTSLASHRHSSRRRAPLRTSLLVARVLEGFREPASALAVLIAPTPPVALKPVPVRPRRDRSGPPR